MNSALKRFSEKYTGNRVIPSAKKSRPSGVLAGVHPSKISRTATGRLVTISPSGRVKVYDPESASWVYDKRLGNVHEPLGALLNIKP